ncbi:hypothetical protein AZO1586I_491 [Bathymodiolus thermophilus thioautotrophic gill symbiont]|uniref:Uncharacterized protein n=2 Tax=sulfur-oxidizing symbionts TaxID=32036 RepID=A0ACA8ZUG8_9GAMM|nr:hypothetical protein AZO1586I_491 [Bathymodiolus thermophilus thioautotrophic gill symbiont]CAB5505025.1 hypothetical protein AZO1586R_1854 [Bathymodiolus azoricus thioautotrophic gill symbiont]CAC9513565.1 hypothetical protein [uncultured Gammaproteobacteria bacterium]CAC9987698.1 hypothetical protein [uncultured Gammaproteobacteria bacterium]
MYFYYPHREIKCPNPKIEPPNPKIPIKILKNHSIQVLHP